METEFKIVIGIFIGIVFIIIAGIVIRITGIHINTGNGSHVGYITATEISGILFKTKSAYIKTDTQSSQEDSYCVIDNDVFLELKRLSEKHARVEVSYFEYLSTGISNCGLGQMGIINKVKEIN